MRGEGGCRARGPRALAREQIGGSTPSWRSTSVEGSWEAIRAGSRTAGRCCRSASSRPGRPSAATTWSRSRAAGIIGVANPELPPAKPRASRRGPAPACRRWGYPQMTPHRAPAGPKSRRRGSAVPPRERETTARCGAFEEWARRFRTCSLSRVIESKRPSAIGIPDAMAQLGHFDLASRCVSTLTRCAERRATGAAARPRRCRELRLGAWLRTLAWRAELEVKHEHGARRRYLMTLDLWSQLGLQAPHHQLHLADHHG